MRFSDLLGEPDEPPPRHPHAGSATGGRVEPPVAEPDDRQGITGDPEAGSLAFLTPVSDDLLPQRGGRRRAQPPGSGSGGRS